jgi:hypothetical protein
MANEHALFNIQAVLSEMRKEQLHANEMLVKRVDDGFDRVTDKVLDLDKRLIVVEGSQRRAIWMVRSVITAMLVFAGDALRTYIK